MGIFQPILLRVQQVRKLIQVSMRPNIARNKILLRRNTSQNTQRTTKLSLKSKANIRIRTITNHAGPATIELELTLNGIHHSLAGFAKCDRLLIQHHYQRRAHGASAREQSPRVRKGGVDVRGEEDRPTLDVVVCQRDLEVVHVEVETDEDDGNFGVYNGFIACRDLLVVRWCDVAAVCGVCAANEWDVLRAKFLLDACFADHVNLALVFGELEDARDVYG